MTFRDRLIGTLRLLRPILEQPGVLVVGSEVPNLLEPDAASTLVVSLDVDIAIPVDGRDAVKPHLRTLEGLVPSSEEPSVYVPRSPALIEVISWGSIDAFGMPARPTSSTIRNCRSWCSGRWECCVRARWSSSRTSACRCRAWPI